MDLLRNLTEAVAASGITTPAQFEAVALRLSPAQARLFELLHAGPADTIEIRRRASLGNSSEAATSLNATLQRGQHVLEQGGVAGTLQHQLCLGRNLADGDCC